MAETGKGAAMFWSLKIHAFTSMWVLLLAGLLPLGADAQGRRMEGSIETLAVRGNLSMLVMEPAGNVLVSTGADGVAIIDDQFAPQTPRILEAVKALSDQPVRYVFNTHWHGDHTGGNVNMAKAGATIMAHDNVRKRLEETPMRDNSKRPAEALPVITFNDKMSMYINGEHVAIFHVDEAHTDGDVIIYFTESNVLHTGDTYFKERYPYIDLNSGGSLNGYIAAVERTLMLIDEETKIIPGHGTVSNKAEYRNFLKMMKTIKANVQAEIDKGKSEEEVAVNGAVTKQYDNLGYGSGFINSERARRIFYKSLKN